MVSPVPLIARLGASNYPEPEISPEGVPDYYVSTLYYGGVDLEHLDCVLALGRQYPSLGRNNFRITGCAYIDIGRATAAAAAIRDGKAGLFFIDHDIIFDPRDVVAMMRAAERSGSVVYGLYSMRKTGRRMIGAFDDSVEGPVTCFRGGKLYPGRYGGLGFAAIPRQVLLDVGAHMLELETGWSRVRPLFALRAAMPDWPELFDALVARGLLKAVDRQEVACAVSEISEDSYAGEDIAFFHRVARAGHKAIVDTRPRVWHKGTYRYGLEDVQVAVPRALELDLSLCRVDDPEIPQPMLAAAQSQFEGILGPLIGASQKPAAE